jgi:hypothetical protein
MYINTGEDNKNKVIFNYLKKLGHVKANCFKLLKKNQVQGEVISGGTRNNMAGMLEHVLFCEKLWF